MPSILSLVFWMYVAWKNSVTPVTILTISCPLLWPHYSVSDRLGVCVKMDSILRVLPRHSARDGSTLRMWPLSLWSLGWYGGWWWEGRWKLCKGDATTTIHRYQPMDITSVTTECWQQCWCFRGGPAPASYQEGALVWYYILHLTSSNNNNK